MGIETISGTVIGVYQAPVLLILHDKEAAATPHVMFADDLEQLLAREGLGSDQELVGRQVTLEKETGELLIGNASPKVPYPMVGAKLRLED